MLICANFQYNMIIQIMTLIAVHGISVSRHLLMVIFDDLMSNGIWISCNLHKIWIDDLISNNISVPCNLQKIQYAHLIRDIYFRLNNASSACCGVIHINNLTFEDNLHVTNCTKLSLTDWPQAVVALSNLMPKMLFLIHFSDWYFG